MEYPCFAPAFGVAAAAFSGLNIGLPALCLSLSIMTPAAAVVPLGQADTWRQ
jgi:hypothetical protein